jgi:hypothetical protein
MTGEEEDRLERPTEKSSENKCKESVKTGAREVITAGERTEVIRIPPRHTSMDNE